MGGWATQDHDIKVSNRCHPWEGEQLRTMTSRCPTDVIHGRVSNSGPWHQGVQPMSSMGGWATQDHDIKVSNRCHPWEGEQLRTMTSRCPTDVIHGRVSNSGPWHQGVQPMSSMGGWATQDHDIKVSNRCHPWEGEQLRTMTSRCPTDVIHGRVSNSGPWHQGVQPMSSMGGWATQDHDIKVSNRCHPWEGEQLRTMTSRCPTDIIHGRVSNSGPWHQGVQPMSSMGGWATQDHDIKVSNRCRLLPRGVKHSSSFSYPTLNRISSSSSSFILKTIIQNHEYLLP